MTDPNNVQTAVRPAPYPSDTKAKGWRFELDYEAIDQSDTWDLAAELPMAQHALLMMWYVAWKQEPCGSLPNDEAIIRAKIKLTPKMWVQCRDVLMRNWWLAADGRLYHDTISKRVLALLEKRAADTKRTRENRARKAGSQPGNDGVTRDTPATPSVDTGEFDTKHPAPSTQHQAPVSPDGDTPLAAAAPGEADGVGFVPTPAGVICKALKSAGIASVAPGNQSLITLLEAGATLDEFMALVDQAKTKGNPFTWMLATLVNQRKRAADDAKAMLKGPMAPQAKPAKATNAHLESDHGGCLVDEPI